MPPCVDTAVVNSYFTLISGKRRVLRNGTPSDKGTVIDTAWLGQVRNCGTKFEV
jgi:hypothetical protein